MNWPAKPGGGGVPTFSQHCSAGHRWLASCPVSLPQSILGLPREWAPGAPARTGRPSRVPRTPVLTQTRRCRRGHESGSPHQPAGTATLSTADDLACDSGQEHFPGLKMLMYIAKPCPVQQQWTGCEHATWEVEGAGGGAHCWSKPSSATPNLGSGSFPLDPSQDLDPLSWNLGALHQARWARAFICHR